MILIWAPIYCVSQVVLLMKAVSQVETLCHSVYLCILCVQEAESLYKNMVKRFRQQKAVYLSYGTFLLRQRQSDAANALLQKALQSLSTKDRECQLHVILIPHVYTCIRTGCGFIHDRESEKAI